MTYPRSSAGTWQSQTHLVLWVPGGVAVSAWRSAVLESFGAPMTLETRLKMLTPHCPAV